jgi:dUTP pyrophosphatase
MIKVQIIKNTLNDLPKYETIESAGCDLRADLYNIDNKYLYKSECIYNLGSIVPELHIKPGGRALIPTGLKIALPVGYEAQIRPRSGLALKSGITVLNTPGTIDASPKIQIIGVVKSGNIGESCDANPEISIDSNESIPS